MVCIAGVVGVLRREEVQVERGAGIAKQEGAGFAARARFPAFAALSGVTSTSRLRRGEVSLCERNSVYDVSGRFSVEEFDPVEHERSLAQFANDRALTPDKLAAVAQKMANATDPAGVERYGEELRRPWYGGKAAA